MQKTNEEANCYEFSLDHSLEFFSKAGSLFEKKTSFYQNEETALSLFQKTWVVDPLLSFKLLLWLRDCRGGAGNRSGFRSCLRWLAENDPLWVENNIHWVPMIGRWDDLRILFGTPSQYWAARIWAKAIGEKDVLATKWADRKDKPLQAFFNTNESGLRKILADIRKGHIVEHKMCSDQWNEIEYPHVPSVAMARYTKAFNKHDKERFAIYKESLKKGEAKVHSDVLFPHDCVRTVQYGDADIANAQFDALPNYMDTDARVIVISDTSGSMKASIAGSVLAVHVSQGMALYCSAKIPKNNPFHKKFIGFCDEGSFKDWNEMSFSQAVMDRKIFDGAIGSTYISGALDLILKTAKFFSLPDSMMPNMLIIVSDMQFHAGTKGDKAEVENRLDKWIENGYSIPKVVYWNTAGYAGSPVTSKHNNVGLVSGFSPSILKAVFGGEDFSPKAIMLRALEKYDGVIDPR